MPGFDEKILALYAKGMTTRDIQEIVQELYGVEVSATLISEITADLDAEVTAWRTRPLDVVWPIVYFDGIVVHARGDNGRVSAAHGLRGLGRRIWRGKKELLGLWLGENEGAKFWLRLSDRSEEPRAAGHLRGLHRRAVRVCRGGPRGLPADEGAIVHRASGACRSALREHAGQQAGDPPTCKKIYQARDDHRSGASGFDEFCSSLGREISDDRQDVACQVDGHHHAVRFPGPIRKAIYTTNAIESVNSVIRKFTRNRKIYPNEESALKIVYMAIHEAAKKWTMPIRNWKEALNHFAILFECRLPG